MIVERVPDIHAFIDCSLSSASQRQKDPREFTAVTRSPGNVLHQGQRTEGKRSAGKKGGKIG